MSGQMRFGSRLTLAITAAVVVLGLVAYHFHSHFDDFRQNIEQASQLKSWHQQIAHAVVQQSQWNASLSQATYLPFDEARDAVRNLGEPPAKTWLRTPAARGFGSAHDDRHITALRTQLNQLDACLGNVGSDRHHLPSNAAQELTDRWLQHLAWIDSLSRSVELKQPFGSDPRLETTAFGRWYVSYRSPYPEYDDMLELWREPLIALHEAATRIVESQDQQRFAKASRHFQEEAIGAIDRLHDAYKRTTDWIANTQSHQQASRQTQAETTLAAAATVQQTMETIRTGISAQAEQAEQLIADSTGNIYFWALLLATLALIAGAASMSFVARSTRRPMTVATEFARRVGRDLNQYAAVLAAFAKGDLTVDVPRPDYKRVDLASTPEAKDLSSALQEMGHGSEKVAVLLRELRGKFDSVIQEIDHSSRDLASAASQLRASASDSRAQTDHAEVFRSVLEVVDTVTEQAHTVHGNADRANQAARQASETAQLGGEIVKGTIDGIQGIADVVRDSAGSIGKLAESAQQIGQVIEVIDDIADQTNLLALNAAIEAARAGEQGRGFAVVADEVRKLAERTGEATKQIHEMIGHIQSRTTEAVKGMKSGDEKVTDGRELADQAGTSLGEIITSSSQVVEIIKQITGVSEQQTGVTVQLREQIEQLSAGLEQSQADVRRASTAAEDLAHRAEQLQLLAKQFKTRHSRNGVPVYVREEIAKYITKGNQVLDDDLPASAFYAVSPKDSRSGRWYHGDGMTAFGHMSEFKTLAPLISKVFDSMNNAVESYTQGRTSRARQLAKEATRASEQLLAKVDALEEALGMITAFGD